ncbi:phenylalanine--tRNA ligase subunit alpha, partial [Candidatus Woesebacteria bacterium]|nr:phenylalanine--tRNA ligase subunit alpha [Candidatus Woesebacteria bacterium]
MLDLTKILESIKSVSTPKALEEIEVRYLGRSGEVNKYAQSMKTLAPEKRKEFGIELNNNKQQIVSLIAEKRQELSLAHKNELLNFDTSLPGIKQSIGHLHPTSLVIRDIYEYFSYLGYSVYEGPEIETDEYNFDKLNLPLDHPARDLQDTLYISEPEHLLRTHTSSVETRCLTTEELPIRIITPGKCYRNESTNASNNAIFYQLEGLVVDKGIHMGHLKATLEGFAKFLYGDNTVTRFRCKYYPQVEPGVGMDIQCQLCHGKGCAVCKYRGWLEVVGAGMTHPHLLQNCGIDSTQWSGFAFGFGLDRLVMMRYGITDIRSLYNGEMVWK